MRRIGWVVGVLAAPALALVTGGPPATGAEPCTLRGTVGDDVLVGTSGPDVLCGLGGNDVLRGRGGDDVLRGGDGDDTLIGRDGADLVDGDAGRDWLVPGRGDDVVDGGSESDTVTYRELAGGVAIDLVAGTATGAAAGTDALASLELVIGTAGDDSLVGTVGKERIDGSGGDDLIVATGGRDTVQGGGGTDTLDYSNLDHHVQVSLTTGYFDGSRAEGRLAAIENLVGTPYGDSLIGDAGPNELSGGAGNDTHDGNEGDDTLIGGSGRDWFIASTGSDEVDGGSDVDTVDYQNDAPAITADLDAGTIDEGGGDIDHVTNVQTVHATSGKDYLHGGLGATAVTFYGVAGRDDISTVDGHGGDKIITFLGPATCVGDAGDSITCLNDRHRAQLR